MVSNSTEIVLGNIEKDSKYRKRIEDNTKEASHPRNQGVIMQAHHLISGDAVKRSSIKELMLQYGYDINNINNLVLLPYTLEGACHLEVQLHRGNHASPSADELLHPDDRGHPTEYHETVKFLLDELDQSFHEQCEGVDSKIDNLFRDKLDKISKKILKKIEKFDRAYQLTSVCDSFAGKSALLLRAGEGCCGVKNVPDLNKVKNKAICPNGRNHHRGYHFGLGVKVSITYKKVAYTLNVGK